MGKIFRPSSREAKILSRIESSKEYARRKGIESARDHVEPLSNAIAMKLIESHLVETTNKNVLEEEIAKCIKNLSHYHFHGPGSDIRAGQSGMAKMARSARGAKPAYFP